MTKKKQTTDSWKIFLQNWRRVTSPGRPTLGEIKIYEKFGFSNLKKKDSKILILGSTPELRDMLALHKNVQVCLVDINLDATLAMTELMKNKRAKQKETWIRGNWLNVPLQGNYFDIIYGDFVISNLPIKFQDKFLKNIKNWLKPRGYFISRITMPMSENKNLLVEEFCYIFKNKPVNLKTINLFWEFGLCFLGRIKQKNGFKFSPAIFYERLKKYLKNHPNTKIDKILKQGGFLYPLDWVWSARTEKDIRKMILRHFYIKKQEFDPKMNFIYPDAYPIYCLKPR